MPGTAKPATRKRAVNPIVEGGRKHLGGERPPEAWDDVMREFVTPEELERRTVVRQAAHPHVFGEHIPQGMPPLTRVGGADELLMIDVNLVVESPDNPREEFDPVLLQELADGIRRTNGVLQPILVLPLFGGTWELVDGARRLRATKLAGFDQIAASVRAMTPKEAALARLEANARRQDINPLEKARAIERAISKQGATQDEIGAALGIKQSTVSNHLRVLRLPEAWHALIANRVISEAHAKLVVPYVEYPAIMEGLLELADKEVSVSDFEGRMRNVIRQHTRTMTRSEWGDGIRFKPTPANEKELKTIKCKNWDGKPEERATNVELWDRLQAEAEEARAAKDRMANEKHAAAAADNGRTPAEEKALREKQAKTRAKQLYRYKVRWLQERIAALLPAVEVRVIFALLLYYCGPSRNSNSRNGGPGDKNFCAWLADVPDTEARAREELAVWIQHSAEGYYPDTSPELVEDVAKTVGVDWLRDWQPDDPFLGLWSRQQLLDIAWEWGIDVGTTMKRAELAHTIATFMGSARRPMPEELRKIKAVSLV